ncbi:hypothetical protein HZA57_06845 [Candidatus Poribacteria bacterium]|nr:hypothetical protein [Candidatus Poribacteria bacterium]
MKHDWRTAFLHQAASDYRMFKRLHAAPGVERCHAAHCLQMMAEKAAKSLRTRGPERPVADHHALTRFIRGAKQNPALIRRWGGKEQRFFQLVDGLMGFACAIERFAPRSDAELPNSEYPWMPAGTSDVRVPCEYAFPELGAGMAPLPKKFLELFEIYFHASGIPVSISASRT